MSGRKPSVFLSSTCYDLKQVREDLFQFLQNDLSYQVLASERGSFPIDPDLNTVDNCRRVVIDHADCLVLMVGGRYGSVVPQADKSVTNIEYNAARTKRIPIFAFVRTEILTLLPTWEANPDGDWAHAVDTPRLFEFVADIRQGDGVWTFPFETAQDIIDVLRDQFAYLQHRGLQWQRQFRDHDEALDGLTGETFRIALERPDGWKGLLFASALKDELASCRDVRIAYDAELAFGRGERVPLEEAFDWIRSKTDELLRLISGVTTLVNQSLAVALDAGEADVILYSARELGRAYRNAIEWTNALRRAHIDERFSRLIQQIGRSTARLLQEMEQLGPQLESEIARSLAQESVDPVEVRVTFNIEIDNADKMHEELDRLSRLLGHDPE